MVLRSLKIKVFSGAQNPKLGSLESFVASSQPERARAEEECRRACHAKPELHFALGAVVVASQFMPALSQAT